ncbi:MAG: hypothetical protein IH888_04220 [Planctomycetes bacterium]|nr:hypothetical protein [Planctomycetota bacterium]
MSEILDKYLETLGPTVSPDYPRIGARVAAFIEKGEHGFDRKTVDAYRRSRKRVGVKDSTVLKEFHVMRRVFMANQEPWPFKRGEGPRVSARDRWAPSAEAEFIVALIEATPGLANEHRALLAMSTTYGMRREELSYYWDSYEESMVGLGPDDFDKKHTIVYVTTAKGGRERYHLIPDAIKPYLEAYDWRPRAPSTVSQIFREIRRQANLDFKGVAWHAIRRGIVSALLEPTDEDVQPLTESQADLFMRWSQGPENKMVKLYQTGQKVGLGGVETDMGRQDEQVDRRVFELLPWLSVWENLEVPSGQPD